jgi:hypothetical protein
MVFLLLVYRVGQFIDVITGEVILYLFIYNEQDKRLLTKTPSGQKHHHPNPTSVMNNDFSRVISIQNRSRNLSNHLVGFFEFWEIWYQSWKFADG